jgi:hypothetical protein
MSAARLVGAFVPVLLLVIAGVGTWWVLRQERRESSYARRGVPVELGGEPSLEEWRQMSTKAQAAYDNSVLDAAESADATAARMAEAAKRNALFHP